MEEIIGSVLILLYLDLPLGLFGYICQKKTYPVLILLYLDLPLGPNGKNN